MNNKLEAAYVCSTEHRSRRLITFETLSPLKGAGRHRGRIGNPADELEVIIKATMLAVAGEISARSTSPPTRREVCTTGTRKFPRSANQHFATNCDFTKNRIRYSGVPFKRLLIVSTTLSNEIGISFSAVDRSFPSISICCAGG
nr:unnamed protein product [Spirometra erinaceieuropaei]